MSARHCVYGFAVVAGSRWSRTDRTAGLLMTIAGATGLLTLGWGFLIDLQFVRSPYVGLVPSTLLVLIATILFSREHAAREIRLKASEARLAAVIANSPGVAVQWFDERGRVVLWNRASEQLFGITAVDAIGKTLDQLFYPPDQFPAFLETLATIQRTGDSVGQMEFTFNRGTETRICVSTLFEIPGDIGSSRFVCMDVDITDRKRVENALAVSEARYRTLTESAPEAIVVLDVETKRIVDMNPEACRMFATTSEALSLVSPIEISPPLQPDGRDSAAAATRVHPGRCRRRHTGVRVDPQIAATATTFPPKSGWFACPIPIASWCAAVSPTSPTASGSKNSSGSRRRWRRSASWPAASPTTSTIS